MTPTQPSTRRNSRMSNHPKDHLQQRSNLAHRITIVLAVVLSAATHLLAQTSSGTSSVGGTVRDPSGRVMSQAHVVLLDKQHGTKRETFTNDEGGYQFSGIPTGLYSVTVDQAGFRTTAVDNVHVIIDQLAAV